jgi:hypothetical protein
MSHQVDITISTVIISKRDKVAITVSCISIHWSAYICVYKD